MKAAVRTQYGSSEVLHIQEVAKPMPKGTEVLVKVYATTVNRSDYHVLTGKPFFMRFFTGLFKPTLSITGSDFAGQVEATGKNVKLFKAGDRVMGFIDMGLQSHAQYLAIDENMVVFTPSNATYDEAAACLEGAFYAISGMSYIDPKPGQKALVIGATGAIGASYVQYFKYYNVEITAVCRAEHSALVKGLGAVRTIDYQTEDFTQDTERYDFVFDAVGGNSFSTCKHLLKDGGAFQSTGGTMNILLSLITPLKGGKKVIFPIPRDLIANLNFIRDLVEKGSFRPLIDKKFPLEKISDAYTYVGSGQKVGNVIITMEH